MLKNLVTNGAYTTGNIPMTVYKQTNGKYALNSDNSISIKTDGLTEIKANVLVTGTVIGDLSLVAYVDGVALPGAIDTQTLAVGDSYTFHINDIIKTIYQTSPSFVELSFKLSGACTIDGGDIILTYER